MRRMEVVVSADHIRRGQPKNITAGPIALALHDRLLWARVSPRGWYGNSIATYEGVGGRLSQAARDFVDRFDKGKPVSPRRFLLQVDEGGIEL